MTEESQQTWDEGQEQADTSWRGARPFRKPAERSIPVSLRRATKGRPDKSRAIPDGRRKNQARV